MGECLSAEGLSNESIAIRLWRDEGAFMLTLVVVVGGGVGGRRGSGRKERVKKMERVSWIETIEARFKKTRDSRKKRLGDCASSDKTIKSNQINHDDDPNVPGAIRFGWKYVKCVKECWDSCREPSRWDGVRCQCLLAGSAR